MKTRPDDITLDLVSECLGVTEEDLARMAINDEDWECLRVTEEELARMVPTVDDLRTMTEEDWKRIRITRQDLARLRDDLRRRPGMGEQDLAWLNREIERRDHGHSRPQTDTD